MDTNERRYKAMPDRVIGLYDDNKPVFDTKQLIKQYFIEATVSRNAMQLAMDLQAGGSTKGSTKDLLAQKQTGAAGFRPAGRPGTGTTRGHAAGAGGEVSEVEGVGGVG